MHAQQPVEQLVGAALLAVQQTNSRQLDLRGVTPTPQGGFAPNRVGCGTCANQDRDNTADALVHHTYYIYQLEVKGEPPGWGRAQSTAEFAQRHSNARGRRHGAVSAKVTATKTL